MRGRTEKRPHGELRLGQVVTTFGPGAMVDLPGHSVIIAGLDHWTEAGRRPIAEERLAAKVAKLLDLPSVRLESPPADLGQPDAPVTGITGWLFPEWFIAQFEEPRGEHVRRRPLVHRRGLYDGRFMGSDKKRYPIVPVRFVQACPNGHIDDIDWPAFTHSQPRPTCTRQALWLEERGTSGELADVYAECDCGASRSLGAAASMDAIPLGHCRGRRAWLGPMASEKCGGEKGKALPNRLLIRSATNAYFPQVMGAISIPDRDALLRSAVDRVWEDFLQYVEDAKDLVKERKKAKVHAALEGFADEPVMAEIQRRKMGALPDGKSLKRVELETFLATDAGSGEDVPEGVFFARAIPRLETAGPMAAVERVVLVHRLREVVAQVGFTRFEADVPDVDGELSLDVKRAPLARETTWVPAVENRGEGVFVGFKKDAIERWLQRKEVRERGDRLRAGFMAWAEEHPGAKAEFLGLPYYLLHSLAHLLVTSIALECGYAASSLRERIYAGEAGYGILLYTGTSDAEGTLGGLVEVGRRFAHHLESALELGRLCSNDPVCAQHDADGLEERRFTHGAACHGCLLIAETSCERRNDCLDRALVVETVEGSGAAFFEEPA